MLELLFNVLLQLAILTGGTPEEAKAKAQGQSAKTTTQAASSGDKITTKGIGAGGWDDKD